VSQQWQQILVVDADAEHLGRTRAALTAGGYPHVTVTNDPLEAADMVRRGRFDLVITARHFPAYDGFDLLRRAHAVDARLPVLVTTDDGDVTSAVEAIRLHAADLLVRPVDPAVMLERVSTVLRERKARRGREVVLAVGAHPDDVEIGAGATLLAHRARGDRVAILIMSLGERGGMAAVRGQEAAAAADLLGAELMVGSLEDTRIPDTGAAVELVEESVAWVGATRVYTHSAADRHQDHHNTHRAVTIATRQVPRVFAFQSPSCTIDYRPTRFEAIDDMLQDKLALIACHRSQVASRDYLDDEFVTATARYWSRYGTSRYAEAFEVLRDVQGMAPARPGASLSESLPDGGLAQAPDPSSAYTEAV
jgi:LmbE family N-acetylglucosaminyl deacetylase